LKKKPLFKTTELALGFDDVLIVPNGSVVASRKEIDLTTKFPMGFNLQIPIFSAAMDTIASPNLGIIMFRYGAGFLLPKTFTLENYKLWFEFFAENNLYNPQQKGILGVAVGIERSIEDIKELLTIGYDCILIEMPIARMDGIENWIYNIANLVNSHNKLLAIGNVISREDVAWLQQIAADGIHMVKVGYGFGGTSTSRWTSGLGIPTLQAIIDLGNDCPYLILGDGGIRNPGDLAKVLAAGGCAGVCGTLFAGTAESAGKEIVKKEKKLKQFRGMASIAAKRDRGDKELLFQQGSSGLVPWRGPAKIQLKRIEEGLRIAVATTGCKTLDEFKNNAQFIKVSHGVPGLIQNVEM
jgi:IMP dehydrogenase